MTQDELENRITQAIDTIAREAQGTPNLRWALTRGLIHRAIHYAAQEGSGIEYCAVATYLGEMLGHAHKLAHGEGGGRPDAHKDMVH
jgi:hypothetical protein